MPEYEERQHRPTVDWAAQARKQEEARLAVGRQQQDRQHHERLRPARASERTPEEQAAHEAQEARRTADLLARQALQQQQAHERQAQWEAQAPLRLQRHQEQAQEQERRQAIQRQRQQDARQQAQQARQAAEQQRLQRLATAQRQALPGQVAAFSRMNASSSASHPQQRQREQVAPVLQALDLRQQDELAVQRSQDELSMLQRAVVQSRQGLAAEGLTEPNPLDVVKLQRSQQQMASAEPRRPHLSPEQHQALKDTAQNDLGVTLSRAGHARPLPPSKRAEMAQAAVQRYVGYGLDRSVLNDLMVQRAPDDETRDSVERLLSVQRRQYSDHLVAHHHRGLRLSHHSLQRQVQATQAEHDAHVGQSLSQRVQARQGGGTPLPEDVMRHLEHHLNADLSRVRIHSDAEADTLARSVNAVAFTTGHDIYFQNGRYDPYLQTGRELLIHEVTHTLQQAQGQVPAGIDGDANLETAAQEAGQTLAPEPISPIEAAPRRRGRGKAGAGQTGAEQAVQRLADPKASGRQVATPVTQAAEAQAVVQVLRDLLSPAVGKTIITDSGGEKLNFLRAAVKRHPANDGFWLKVIHLCADQHGQPLIERVMPLLPTDLKATFKLALLGGEAELTYAAFLNQLAFLSYDNTSDHSSAKGMVKDRAGSTASGAHAILFAAGYRALPPVQGLWGFQMQIFKPIPGKAKYKHTIVAFRGTEGLEPNFLATVKINSGKQAQETNESHQDTMADLAPYATAYSQYEVNAKRIIDPLLNSLGNNLVATGHSLGGGLAQIAVAKHASQFSELYTFQGASIKKADVDRLDKLNPKLKARHFRMNFDGVPSSGEQAVSGEVYDVSRTTGQPLNIQKLNTIGGHNTPIGPELLRSFQASGRLSTDNVLAQVLMTQGSQDVARLEGYTAQIELEATYPTKIGQKMIDRKPGREGMKQEVPGTLYHGMFVDTYKNNAIYNILMEHAMPKLEGLKYGGDVQEFIRDLETIDKTTLAQGIAHTASSELMLKVIFDKPVTDARKQTATIEQILRDIPTFTKLMGWAGTDEDQRNLILKKAELETLIAEYEACRGLKYDDKIERENRVRFRNNLIDVWYSLHPGSEEAYLKAKPMWPHHDQ